MKRTKKPTGSKTNTPEKQIHVRIIKNTHLAIPNLIEKLLESPQYPSEFISIYIYLLQNTKTTINKISKDLKIDESTIISFFKHAKKITNEE